MFLFTFQYFHIVVFYITSGLIIAFYMGVGSLLGIVGFSRLRPLMPGN
jgi:hypothetical protein